MPEHFAFIVMCAVGLAFIVYRAAASIKDKRQRETFSAVALGLLGEGAKVHTDWTWCPAVNKVRPTGSGNRAPVAVQGMVGPYHAGLATTAEIDQTGNASVTGRRITETVVLLTDAPYAPNHRRKITDPRHPFGRRGHIDEQNLHSEVPISDRLAARWTTTSGAGVRAWGPKVYIGTFERGVIVWIREFIDEPEVLRELLLYSAQLKGWFDAKARRQAEEERRTQGERA